MSGESAAAIAKDSQQTEGNILLSTQTPRRVNDLPPIRHFEQAK
jgi:hypothetical protein